MRRLGYRKSKNGCLPCKQRRVKCDEEVPCSACVRHSLHCPLQDPKKPAKIPSPELLSQLSSTTSDAGSTPTDGFPVLSTFSCGLSPIGESDWTKEMELIHHYTAIGYLAISASKTVHDTLQHTVPRLAFSCDYLLHQILSLSALHLAYLRPETRSRYWHLASQHQNESIKGMRGALMQDVTSQSCHPLYVSSILLVFSGFGRLARHNNNSECDLICEGVAGANSLYLDGLLDIFRSIHGISTILSSSEIELRLGPLKPLFEWTSDPSISAPHLQSVAQQMSLMLGQLPVPPTPFDENSRVIFGAGTSLIDSLVAVTRTLHSETLSEMRAVFFWPVKVSARFVDLARQQDPSAMVIIAHYCVILHLAEASCWFLRGWAAAVLNPISTQLRGTPFEELIRWPTDTVLHD